MSGGRRMARRGEANNDDDDDDDGGNPGMVSGVALVMQQNEVQAALDEPGEPDPPRFHHTHFPSDSWRYEQREDMEDEDEDDGDYCFLCAEKPDPSNKYYARIVEITRKLEVSENVFGVTKHASGFYEAHLRYAKPGRRAWKPHKVLEHFTNHVVSELVLLRAQNAIWTNVIDDIRRKMHVVRDDGAISSPHSQDVVKLAVACKTQIHVLNAIRRVQNLQKT